jgi:hypothetical protein
VRYLVFLFLALIVFNLGAALFHISRGNQTNPKTVRNLTWRVGLSVALFLMLMIAYRFGFIGEHL